MKKDVLKAETLKADGSRPKAGGSSKSDGCREAENDAEAENIMRRCGAPWLSAFRGAAP